MSKEKPPQIDQVEMTDADIEFAERIAAALGYEQTAYTSSSALWGLFCLNENPATWRGNPQALKAGCIIKTKQFGFLFVQDLEDLQLHDLYAETVRE
jgi:hypothetical protein